MYGFITITFKSNQNFFTDLQAWVMEEGGSIEKET